LYLKANGQNGVGGHIVWTCQASEFHVIICSF